MGDGKPKYLNSPETKIFDKSRNLYGLHLARSSRRKNLIICEGYMDVISMHQAGFNNAVASLGTALTSLQAGLMKRYTDEVLVIYDSDEAGVKAALRAIPMLKGVGLTTRVVNLRPYKDPDEFIQHEGCEAFEKRLEEAENSVLYEIRMKERDFDLADPQGKSDFLHEAVRRLVAIEDEIERNSYLEAVAGKYGIAVEVLRKQVGQSTEADADVDDILSGAHWKTGKIYYAGGFYHTSLPPDCRDDCAAVSRGRGESGKAFESVC